MTTTVDTAAHMRLFTTAGVDPYGTVNWSMRPIQILDDTGTSIFSAEVEAPETWGTNAVQVAASKYFGLDRTTGIRETSICQMIERVVKQITEWGRAQGYFGEDDTLANDEKEHAFADELRYILLHQMAAFNSPVWFNFGTKGHEDVSSACFILGIDDSIASISEASRDMRQIFKNGSGAGTNMSALRSSHEGLSSGGKASGPVSFMHGYDSDAGCIKSGGTTRRAALLISLNMDHGDIREFITSKATEEYKAHMLLEMAGLSEQFAKVSPQLLEQALLSVANHCTTDEDKATFVLLDKLRQGTLIAPYLREFIKQHTWSGFKNNEAYGTVGLQNMNIPVSVPDIFMRKVTGLDPDPTWYLLARPTCTREEAGWANAQEYAKCAQGHVATFGLDKFVCSEHDGLVRKVLFTENVHNLLRLIAESTSACGDPGVQFTDAMNYWFLAKNTDVVKSTNPCSEVTLPDNTSCNLSSVNLVKFLDSQQHFMIPEFQHVIRIMAQSQDIIIDPSVYPTPAIAENTKFYRALGLGVANLGALLLRVGLPYDSSEGRSYAASIVSLLTATAYQQSVVMANLVGAGEWYGENEEEAGNVLRLHRNASENIHNSTIDNLCARKITHAACHAWDTVITDAFDLCKKGLRNCATTCAAPTGTISLLMSCATSGIEPEYALLKYKRLVGGGTMRFVNDAVDVALTSLGYSDEDRAQLITILETQGHLENTNILKDEHLPVFDCAGLAGADATRVISPEGHLAMMAAIQPVLSMGISKTVNLVNSCSTDEIMQVYTDAWRKGLKAVALYRDGSKHMQPLTTAADYDDVSNVDMQGWIQRAEQLNINNERRRMPTNRLAIAHKFCIGNVEGYLHIGVFDNGKPGEIFVRISKEGSTISGVIDAYATMFSIALQRGTPLEELIQKFSFTRFEPAGWTSCRNIPKAESVIDYIVRYLAFQFLPREDAMALGVKFYDDDEECRDLSLVNQGWVASITECPKEEVLQKGTVFPSGNSGHKKSLIVTTSDAPLCPQCNEQMTRNGSCYRCENCGSTSGCS